MQLVYSAIDVLYAHTIGLFLGSFEVVKRGHTQTPETMLLESAYIPTHDDDEVMTEEQETEVTPEPTFKKIEAVLKQDPPLALANEKNVVMYVGTNETPLYMKPTQEFDTCIGILAYGEMAMVLEQRGRWAKVVCRELEGWVLREDLVDRAAYVYPEFVIGEENDVDDPNTARVRAMLGDTFGGAKVEFPLQAGEYVMYRLKRKGLSIPWPATRPRVPGLWHSILKGVPGIHMGIVPKTGAVMEYVFKEELGHVAYVEAVFPDETIHISEVNYPDRGIYNERIITREEWRELRPVFIQVA